MTFKHLTLDKLITDNTASVSVAESFSVIENKNLMYDSMRIDTFDPVMRGDVDFDGNLDAMDAVIVDCVINEMLNEKLVIKVSDTDGSGTVNEADADMLIKLGIGGADCA